MLVALWQFFPGYRTCSLQNQLNSPGHTASAALRTAVLITQASTSSQVSTDWVERVDIHTHMSGEVCRPGTQRHAAKAETQSDGPLATAAWRPPCIQHTEGCHC